MLEVVREKLKRPTPFPKRRFEIQVRPPSSVGITLHSYQRQLSSLQKAG